MRSGFDALYAISKARFSPLSDPLDVSFGLHRQLAGSREEVFSDWLHWVLVALGDPALVSRVLGTDSLRLVGPLSFERETVVRWSDDGVGGRLDVVARSAGRPLTVIEVKTREYSQLDLQKHLGYLKARGFEHCEFIFLALEPAEFDPGNFRYLSWHHVCLALRCISRDRLLPHQALTTAMILAFVGAVEQNLLGMIRPEQSGVTTAIPRMLDHLKKAQEMEQSIGKPNNSHE